MASGIQSPLLREQINIEQQHQGNQPEEQLWQVCLLNSNHALRPDKIGENQGQQPGGQHQHDEDSDRPKLQIASGKLLNLLLDIFRTRQHRRLNVFLVPRLCHPPSGKNSAGSVLNACTLSPNGTLTLKILTY